MRPHGVTQQLVRVGGRCQVTEDDDPGERRHDEGTDEAVAQQRAPPEAGLLVGLLEDLDRARPGGFLAAGLVTSFDEVVAVHEGLRPVHGSEADTEQAKRDSDAEHHVVHSNGCHVARLDRPDEVGGDRENASDDRQPEQRGDAPLDLDLASRIQVGDALVRRRESGVLNRVSDNDCGARGILVPIHSHLVSGTAVLLCHALTFPKTRALGADAT